MPKPRRFYSADFAVTCDEILPADCVAWGDETEISGDPISATCEAILAELDVEILDFEFGEMH